MFWDAETMMQPTIQMMAPILRRVSEITLLDTDRDPYMMAVFLPNQSDRKPEQRAASQEPPAMDATMPP